MNCCTLDLLDTFGVGLTMMSQQTDPPSEARVVTGHVAPVDATALAQWLVLRTRSRHEKKVHDELVSRRIETFLPLYERWSHWKDRRMRVAFPLFPGYCFVRLPPTERLRALNTPGAAGFLGFNGYAEPVPDTEIAALSRLVTSTMRYDPHPFLTEGMLVEVVRGPLAGVRGTIVRKDRSTKLILAVRLIQQAAALEIHPADVIPV